MKTKIHKFIQKQPPEVFCKKGVLRNFAKFTGKHLCQSLFFNKVAGGAFFTEHVWATAYVYNSLLERNVVYHSRTQKQL